MSVSAPVFRRGSPSSAVPARSDDPDPPAAAGTAPSPCLACDGCRAGRAEASPACRPRLAALFAGALMGGAGQVGAEDGLQPPVDLPTITVTDRRASGDDYLPASVSSGTKTATPLLELPQSMTAIGAGQMRDQGAQSLQDALRYTAGISAEPWGLDSRGDWSFVRGIEPTQYQDGMRVFFDFFSNVRPDLATVETVEVLRGPGSSLFGQGSAGGAVNVLSKLPQAQAARAVELQFGNFDRRQVSVDATGPVSGDGRFLYRFIGLGRDSATQVEHSASDRWLVAPSLTWQPDARTSATVLVNVQRDRGTVTTAFPPWSGTLLDNPNGRLPTSLFTSEPGFDRFDNDQNALTLELEHHFEAPLTWRHNLRYSNSRVDYRTLYPDVFSNPARPFVDAAAREVFRFGYVRQQQDNAVTMDNHLEARAQSGAVRQVLLLGVDYAHDHIDRAQAFSYDTHAFDLFAPVYGAFTPLSAVHEADTDIDMVGLYLQDQVRFGERVVLVGGVRHDQASTAVEGGTASDDSAWTGKIGLVYLFDRGFAPFVGYSQSFNPVASSDVFGEPYRPVRGEQVELGLRYQPTGAGYLLSAALFDLTESNRLSPDPANPLNNIQLGRADIHGAELEITGRVSAELDLVASYTYLHARTRDGIGAANHIAEVPAHSGALWARYTPDRMSWRGLSLGAGVRVVGEKHDESGTLRIPPQALLDLMLAWERGPWRLAVNGTNVTDETYVTSCGQRGDCWYGTRGTVTGAVGYRF